MRSFGELEADIMRLVWERGEPVTVRSLVDTLNESRTLAYTTVITVTERLREKGLLTRTRFGKSYRYTATISADDYSARLMAQVLDASDDRSGALMRFAGQLNPTEADALRAALARDAAETSKPARQR